MPSKVSILTVAGQPGSQFLQPSHSWTTEEQYLRQGQQQQVYVDKGGTALPVAAPRQQQLRHQQQLIQ